MSQVDTRWTELLATVDPAVLGARVRAVRQARGLTQGEVSAGLYSIGYVSRVESGARRPTLSALTALAERLDVSVAELLQGASTIELDEIRLSLNYAELALESGEAIDAEHQAREALSRAEAASVPEMAAQGRLMMARALEATGRIDAAILELEALLEGAEGLIAIKGGIALSRCYREAGDLTLAIEVGDRLRPALMESGLDRTDEAIQLTMTVALAYVERGDLSRAMRLCTEAIGVAEGMDSPAARSAAYWNASVVYSERGDTSAALALATRALALLGEGQDARNLARLRLELGRLQLETEAPDVDRALVHLETAADELRGTSASQAEMAYAQVLLARALVMDGRPDQALDVAVAAREANPVAASLGAAEAAIAHGEALAELQRTEEAVETLHQAAELLRSLSGEDRWVAQAWCELAELYESLGEAAAAHASFKAAAAASGLRVRSRAQARARLG